MVFAVFIMGNDTENDAILSRLLSVVPFLLFG